MSKTQVTANEVAEQLRIPGSSFAISGTVYPKAVGAFAGEGTIRRTEHHFVLHATFAEGAEDPASEGGTYSPEDFWRFEGVIGANLPFVVEHLAPCDTRHWNNGITSQEYDTHTISLGAVGFDKLPVKKLSALLERLETDEMANAGKLPEDFDWEVGETDVLEPSPGPAKEPSVAASAESPPEPNPEPEKPTPYANGTWIHALVPDFPLIHTNGRTDVTEKNSFLGESSRSKADTFSGKWNDVEFGLVRRGEDLNVYLFLPAQADESIPVETHERFLTSFLTGLAFATGQHCWPYRVKIRRNGAQLLDKLNAVRKLDRTTLAPFSERIGFNAAVGQIDWQFEDFLGKAAQFFNSGSELSEAASQALWLLRSAGAKNVPGEITLMSLCVLLESLAAMIFDDKKLSSTQDAVAFEEARAELLKWIGEKKPQDGSGLQRFQNMITNALLERAKDKYQAVSEHFGLQWDGLMKDAWAIWEKVRNKGAHDILRMEKKLKINSHFTAIGRIAGAINVLVLRLIGYSGIARTSVFEDKHHKI